MNLEPLKSPAASASRRHEIDALRVIALGLLIAYHVFICYQPFAPILDFIQYDAWLTDWWEIGLVLNIWRIPVLFMVSGLALGFSFRRRSLGDVVTDRMLRFVPPLVFGTFVLAPLFSAFENIYLGETLSYVPSPGHLWFLLNLVVYVLLVVPVLLYFKRRPDNAFLRASCRLMPFGLLLAVPLPLVIETMLTEPDLFAFFPMRFWFGFVCFFIGFWCASLGEAFWRSVRLAAHVALPIAFVLYLGRIGAIDWAPLQENNALTAYESGNWMLAYMGYGSLLLHRPSKVFAYLNRAVFPIYIIHMVVLQAMAFVLFPWQLPPGLTFFLHILSTLFICLALYEFVLKRLRWLHPVMGIHSPGTPPRRSWRKLVIYGITPVVLLMNAVLFVVLIGNADLKLRSAVWREDLDEARALIAQGADANLVLADGWSTLIAALARRNLELTQLLIEDGADVRFRNQAGISVLEHASLFGFYDGAVLLVERGAAADLSAQERERLRRALDWTHAQIEERYGYLEIIPRKDDHDAARRRIADYLRDAGVL